MFVPYEHGLHPVTLFRARAIGPTPFPMSAPHHTYFYRARNAIYHLFRALGHGAVLVPDYHNGNEVWAMRAAGVPIRFYRIGRNLEPDLDSLSKLCDATGARVLFVIHYFGWPQPVKELLTFCQERGMLLVEDCALSLLSGTLGRPLGSFGQYSTFCLYKTLPVPNGGVLVQNNGSHPGLTRLALDPCGALTLGGRTLELLLEWFRGRAYGPGQAAFATKRAAGRLLNALRFDRVPFGDMGFDVSKVNFAPSTLSLRLLERFDYDEIRRRRRENFRRLRERLEGTATLIPRELEGEMCPLLFPLLVPDKPAAARALRAKGIDAQEFWNDGDPEARGPQHTDAQFLREHVLELPIHQDVTPAQVEYIADQVLHLRLHF
jgi:perosamine synthetase